MSHELPYQSDPISPDEVAKREVQAESAMGQKEAESARARESLIENLRDRAGLDSATFDEIVSSMNFSDGEMAFEFKVRGHKVSGRLERVKFKLTEEEKGYKSSFGGYSEIEEIFVDDIKIEPWMGLDKFVDRYKSVILGLRNVTDERVNDDVEDARIREVRNLVDDLTKIK